MQSPLGVTDNGREIYVKYYDEEEPFPMIMVIKKYGRDILLSNGDISYTTSFNKNNTQFLYTKRVSNTVYNTNYVTYFYNNGKAVKLADYPIKYLGRTSDRDYLGDDLHITGGILKDKYWGYEDSLLDGYFILIGPYHKLKRIDEKGNIKIIVDKDVGVAFSANENGKYVYYGCSDGIREEISAYCMTEGEDVFLAEKLRDLANYNDEGTYILAGFDWDKMTGTLYYCDDGRTLQHVMDNVAYVKAEGVHVYIMVKTSSDKDVYDVYYGNPTDGYEKIEDNVYYEDKDSIL